MIWIATVTVGAVAMLRHEFDGQAEVHAPAAWPSELGVFNPAGRALSLVMVAHPDCPCTRASIAQLERLLAQSAGQTQAIVFVYQMPGVSRDELQNEDFWKRLEQIANLRPIADPAGAIAERLGADVSGSAAAYDREGKLRFQGGLTASRGHEGPSFALEHLRALALGQRTPSAGVASTPAFGCRFSKIETEGAP
jgi:hypothetical protein